MMLKKGILPGLAATVALSVAAAHEPRRDVVLEGNAIAFEQALNEQPPPEQMRFAAILHLAMFEGVNAVVGDYQSTLSTLNAPRGASAAAAAVGAAHKVLRSYFPDRAPAFAAEHCMANRTRQDHRRSKTRCIPCRCWRRFITPLASIRIRLFTTT